MAIELGGDIFVNRKNIDTQEGLPYIPGTEVSKWGKRLSNFREKGRRVIENLKRKSKRARTR